MFLLFDDWLTGDIMTFNYNQIHVHACIHMKSRFEDEAEL